MQVSISPCISVYFFDFFLYFLSGFALYGRVAFMKAVLAFTLRASLRLFKSAPCGLVFIQRKVTKRKDTQHARPAGTLRCSNEPAGCETRYRSDNTSRTPRLILCFSASLNGRFKVNPNTYPTPIISRHSGIPLAGIHSFNLYLDTGMRRYDGTWQG